MLNFSNFFFQLFKMLLQRTLLILKSVPFVFQVTLNELEIGHLSVEKHSLFREFGHLRLGIKEFLPRLRAHSVRLSRKEFTHGVQTLETLWFQSWRAVLDSLQTIDLFLEAVGTFCTIACNLFLSFQIQAKLFHLRQLSVKAFVFFLS